MNDLHLGLADRETLGPPVSHPPIGRLLVDIGKIAPRDLQHALNLQTRIDAPLGDIMISEGLVEKQDVLSALATQARAEGADLALDPPLPEMAARLPAALCLRYGVVPWREDARALYIATSSPAEFTALCAELGPMEKPLFPVIVDEAQIQSHVGRLHGAELVCKAARRVPAAESCRDWAGLATVRSRWCTAVVLGCVLFGLSAPALLITMLALLATVTLLMTTVLKLAALVVHVMPASAKQRLAPAELARTFSRLWPSSKPAKSVQELVLLPQSRADAALRIAGAARAFGGAGLPTINSGDRFRLPRVSVLVPLLHEREIAGQLIDRLSRLTYPKSLLEVVLVLEASDTLTRETIARTSLPDWMRVIEVPEGGDLTTKPRALNYALDFCRGSIIGVWDAEDWPEADQIERVVTRFQAAPAKTACIQGVLDYYNSRTNWLTRCFSIEYATWWRVLLPGIANLGLVVPLGGTTLFFRRRALEALGGWDAHNVTEDADLGLRLARHGYVTELLPTVTHEEATSRSWPWVRQRSRWLKGFLITYFVHMRDVRRLWRDLGPARFMGVQTLFFATVTQFALAPVLWSFWLILAGFDHPVSTTLTSGVVTAMIALFVFSELLTMTAGLVATADKPRRHLIPFLPTMGLYFTLGTFAAYKALWEIVQAPFFWDKTQHGVSALTDLAPGSAETASRQTSS
ncbi:glycosyltransferase family 2 protein [Roseobacter weihaiensis]|uniref:glycosyltransferase family 2 protein n=1 Tax=Roseobacter weihaiensis TaxID=2763262 RepID=UPI001D09D3F1|nr:glycosyltransferase [Roseobacter sp. H9]